MAMLSAIRKAPETAPISTNSARDMKSCQNKLTLLGLSRRYIQNKKEHPIMIEKAVAKGIPGWHSQMLPLLHSAVGARLIKFVA